MTNSGKSSSPLLDDVIIDDFSDYKGRSVLRSNTGSWRAAVFIIGAELLERFAFFGICPNLIIYLAGPLGQLKATAAQNVNAWNGVALFFQLIGAIVADSFLDRYNTIIISSSVYILALGLLTFSVELALMPQFQVIVFFFSIYLMAMSQGGHKPCLQAFGADQFDERDPKECKAKSSFFNRWYFNMSVSVSVSVLFMSYIQEYLSWSIVFGIPCISMVATVKSSDKNPFLRIGRVYARALKNRKSSYLAINSKNETERTCLLQSSRQFEYMHKDFLPRDDSDKKNGASDITDVEDAKTFLRLVPIFLSCLIYAIVLAQTPTFFTEQGKTMDRMIWPKFHLPATSLLIFITITAMLFIPIYEHILVPITRTLTGNQSGITILQRIGVGIFISITSMVVAALVETKRFNAAFENGLVYLPEATVPISVLWLVPQYVLGAISKVFAVVGLQQFFYDEVGSDMKSLGPALTYSVMGVGNFLSVFLIYVVQKFTGGDYGWLCNNLNKAYLDYYYWLLAGLSTVGFVMYAYSAKSYIYR